MGRGKRRCSASVYAIAVSMSSTPSRVVSLGCAGTRGMIAVKKHGTYLLVPAYYEAWASSLFRRHGGLLLGHCGRAKGIKRKYAKRRNEFVLATNINVWGVQESRDRVGR